MAKTFRPYSLDQHLLLPPDLRDWLPEGHLALYVSDVVDALDLSAIYRVYAEADPRGAVAYHPAMLVKLLVYAYCVGMPSSRRIERGTFEDVALRVLAGDQHPDHDTIAAFRQRHLPALAALFLQVLRLCQRAGLVRLGHVALDGTKVLANASKHKAMSYERMGETEQRLEREVRQLLEQAAARDAAEDAQYGTGRRGDELPRELARRESRLRKIREAKAELEAEARAAAAEQADVARAQCAERERKAEETGKRPGGRPPAIPDPQVAVPKPKAQRNFTDPESRIMKDGATKSYVQAYNAQVAVDGTAQVIVAAAVTQEANDVEQLVPLLELLKRNVGRMPVVVTADAGYFSEANVSAEALREVDLYIPPDRQRHSVGEVAAGALPLPEVGVREQMRQKVGTPKGQEVYRLRKVIAEPVFGQTKECRGFRRFAFRGLDNVSAEWILICLTHNVLKLFRSRWQPVAA